MLESAIITTLGDIGTPIAGALTVRDDEKETNMTGKRSRHVFAPVQNRFTCDDRILGCIGGSETRQSTKQSPTTSTHESDPVRCPSNRRSTACPREWVSADGRDSRLYMQAMNRNESIVNN